MNDVTSRLADLPDADAIAAEADALFSLILAAQGREPIPFLNDYIEDFSQYQLRGYYRGSDVLERYFQAMMWLGRITFRLDKPQETTAGLLVMRAMSQASIDGGDFGTYQQVMDTLGFLIGPVDDYTVADYLPVARAAFGDDLELMAFADADRMAAFVADAQRLPPPRINSIALEVEPLTVEEMQDETRGFRLFGQRFTFDGYLMQSLIYPAVGTVDQSRTLPLGLDVVATLGSDRAYALADAEGATDFANYTDAMSRLREEVAVLSDSDWLQNVAGGWLWMLQPLANPDRALLPPMLRTDAWQHKNITATLGSWTQLKYATLLYAERPSGGLGGGGFRPPLTSYSMIEPNPSAFVRLGVLSGLVHQALIDRQYYMSSDGFRQLPLGNIMFGFSLLSDIALELAAIGIRQMTPEGATYDDYYYLQYRFGYHLDLVRYSATVDDPMPEPDTALIADVANNAAAGTVLHAAIGTPDYIYVVTRTPFGLALARGTVYSYYEFVSPIDERLNNDTWREMLIQNPPPRPSWMDLYFVD